MKKHKSNRYSYITLFIAIIITVIITLSGKSVEVDSDFGTVKLGIVMYHGFTSEEKPSEYVIDIADFEKDIIFFKENGFNFVFASEVADFLDGKTVLPKKPVMLTFDDGYLNNYTEAFPVLKKHGVKAVISPIMYFCEADSTVSQRSSAYSNINISEIKEMHNSGLVEFQNHSYNLHSINLKRRGSSKSKNESSDQYRTIFYEDTINAHLSLKKLTGNSPKVYVYPFGEISSESKSVLWCMGYKTALGCAEGFNNLYPSPYKIHILKRFNRTPEFNIKNVFNY